MATEPAKTARLTEEQAVAVAAARRSVALSAGAGCGKTFVLTERFLSELAPAPDRPPTRLSQIIAITFTERAAREMRQRIHAACVERLLECPEDEVQHWLELVREIDAARISTIHSFCGALLRSHAVEAGLDPRFAVLDASQSQVLCYELIDEKLHDLLSAHEAAVIEMAARYGLDRMRAMAESLLSRRAELDFDVWLGVAAEELVERWRAWWQSETLPQVLRRIAGSPEAQRCLQIAKECPSTHAVMRARFASLADLLPRLEESGQAAEDLAALRAAAMAQGGGGKKDWRSDEAKAAWTEAAKGLRDQIDALGAMAEFDPAAALPAAQTALKLLGVAAEVARAYASRKQELAVLDFDDLLIRARELLVGPKREGVRKQIAQQTKLLLVDEFQDTDPLQVELVKALCNDDVLRGTLFFVGDLKQSIYRFRGAQPRVFRTLREEIPAEGRLPLSLNFRSQPAVLDFVNALFAREMGEGYEALRAFRPQIGPAPAVEFLWAVESEDGEHGEDAVAGGAEENRCREADWIARRIRAMLDGGEPIAMDSEALKAGAPKARAVRPGDIAILFRAMTNVQHYEEALRRYGIDYYLVGGKAFYNQQEVFDLANLLQAIDNPADDLSLLGALRSGMFCLNDETLFWLARTPNGLSGGLQAQNLPEEIDAEQALRVRFAAAALAELRAVKDRIGVAPLVELAMQRTGYDALLLAEFLGPRKLANLRKLIEQARSIDHAGIFRLSDFVTQLRELVARQPDESLAATHPEKSDVVRLMSVHQSKGLEFPVVFVADLARTRHSSTAAIAFTPQLGPMIQDPAATTGYDLFAAAEREEDEAEMVRLFYVAATRAADYLVLSAGLKGLDKTPGPWMEILARHFDLETGKLRSGEGAAGNAAASGTSLVRVVTERPRLAGDAEKSPSRPDLAKLAAKAKTAARKGKGLDAPLVGPIAPQRGMRRQFSFSRLHGALERSAAAPADDAPDPLAADARSQRRDLGTLVHAVLAELDLAAPGDITEHVRRHAAGHLADPEKAMAEAMELVTGYLKSPRAAELAKARQMHVELEFLLGWPLEDASAAACPGRHIQGFIDCLYQDAAGAWRVLDYKTNRVTAQNVAEVAANYEMQMLLYGLAVEETLGTSPAELTLHFLRPGLEWSFPWNEAARRRAIEMIDAGLAAM